MTRVLLFTGKGGVGKTTVAAATAMRAAAGGRRVLITSTDPAHSLADVFDRPLDDAPTAVASNLVAQQIDSQVRLEQHWWQVRDYLAELLAWGGLADVQAEELAVVPGLDEIFSLVDLCTHLGSGHYDLVVIDSAPTAETLRLLALPDALRWYVERVILPARHVARAVGPLVSRVSSLPVPSDLVFGAIERIHANLAVVHGILQDADVSSIRLVINPERMVVNEALRTATSLSLFGYAVDAVVVNRVLPDEVTDPYLERWKQRHAEHLSVVRDAFAPTPTLTAPLFADELVGLPTLARLGEAVYGELDESAVLHRTRPLSLERQGDGYRLRIILPFASRDDLELYRRGAELHVKVGGRKRTVPLPTAVRRFDVVGARLTEGVLDVRFAAPAATEGTPRSRPGQPHPATRGRSRS